MKSVIFWTVAALALLTSTPGSPAEINASVQNVVDGDTFDLRTSRAQVRIRLCGIDAPEKGQPGYAAARLMLAQMIDNQNVRCVPVGEGTPCDGRSRATNRDRVVAQCFLREADIAAEMARGYACDWPRFSGGHYRVSSTTCTRN